MHRTILICGLLLLISACAAPRTVQRSWIAPSDTSITYIGRFDMSTPSAPRFDWSASTIEASFEGRSVDVLLVDGQNDYNVYIDDEPVMVLQTTEDTLYTVAQGLKNSIHTVRITRRTEAKQGIATFLGFGLDKDRQLGPAPPRKKRRLLFIGDSITTGYGNEGEDPSCPYSRETENVEQAYAAMTARYLSAEYVTLAYSGKGIIHNYGPDLETGPPMPAYLDQTLAHDPELTWEAGQWQPDVVVINLATNDFAVQPFPTGPAFVEAYLGLLQNVRARYPGADIICIGGPFMQDPARTYIRSTFKQARFVLDSRIHYMQLQNTLDFPDDFGCDRHPNVAGHQKMADQLGPLIGTLMGWTIEQDTE